MSKFFSLRWYYKGFPTCVAANDQRAWDICNADRYICGGVHDERERYGYVRNQIYIVGNAIKQLDNNHQVEGCPLNWNIRFTQTVESFCHPNQPGKL